MDTETHGTAWGRVHELLRDIGWASFLDVVTTDFSGDNLRRIHRAVEKELHLRERYPDMLRRAAAERHQYALQLQSGDVIEFEQCTIQGDWVRLDGIIQYHCAASTRLDSDMRFRQGVTVRLERVVWVAHAPREAAAPREAS